MAGLCDGRNVNAYTIMSIDSQESFFSSMALVSIVVCCFCIKYLVMFKERLKTVTEQLFRSIAQLTDDFSCGLLLLHQTHCLACIDVGQIIVLALDSLCKLLTSTFVL